jgi:hypothetical protein
MIPAHPIRVQLIRAQLEIAALATALPRKLLIS